MSFVWVITGIITIFIALFIFWKIEDINIFRDRAKKSFNPVWAMIFMTLLSASIMIMMHEITHQVVFNYNCINATTSIHMANFTEMTEYGMLAYTSLDDMADCDNYTMALQSQVEIIGYLVIVPMSLIIGLLTAIFINTVK